MSRRGTVGEVGEVGDLEVAPRSVAGCSGQSECQNVKVMHGSLNSGRTLDNPETHTPWVLETLPKNWIVRICTASMNQHGVRRLRTESQSMFR